MFLSISFPLLNVIIIGYFSFVLNLFFFATMVKNSSQFRKFIIIHFFNHEEEFFNALLASTFGNPSRGSKTVMTAVLTTFAGREFVSEQMRREERLVQSRADQIFLMTRKSNATAQEDLRTMKGSHSLAIEQTHTPYTNGTAEGTALIGKSINSIFKNFN